MTPSSMRSTISCGSQVDAAAVAEHRRRASSRSKPTIEWASASVHVPAVTRSTSSCSHAIQYGSVSTSVPSMSHRTAAGNDVTGSSGLQRAPRASPPLERVTACGCASGASPFAAACVAGERSHVTLLDELDQRAEAALGVDEGHGRAAAAGAGRLVDRRGAGGLHRRERRGAVVDAVADVVQALAPLLEVLGDRRVVAGRREQLDVALGHLQQRLLDAVALDDLAVVDDRAERPR